MKWILGIALAAASASIVISALTRNDENEQSEGQLTMLHESASF